MNCPTCGERNGDAALMCGMCGVVLRRKGVPEGTAAAPVLPPAPTLPSAPKLLERGPRPTARVEYVYEAASPWLRLVAFLIDLVVVALLGGVVVIPVVMLTSWGADASDAFIGALGSIPALVYFTAMEWSPLQATLGKLALGLRVTDSDGEQVGPLRSLVRALAKTYLSVLPIGIAYWWCLRDDEGRCFHDIIAGTFVVRRVRM